MISYLGSSRQIKPLNDRRKSHMVYIKLRHLTITEVVQALAHREKKSLCSNKFGECLGFINMATKVCQRNSLEDCAPSPDSNGHILADFENQKKELQLL